MKPKYFLFLPLYFILLSFSFSEATIRFVSKTGTSTPPFLSWNDAADSIQKCINICVDGDTVYVANGIYQESLVVNKYLWLIGSNMDSTVIDGTSLTDITIDFQADGGIQNFSVKGKGIGFQNSVCIWANLCNVTVSHTKICNAKHGISLIVSSSLIKECFINNVKQGYGTYCAGFDTCNSSIQNSIIITNNELDAYGIRIEGGGNNSYNNIVLIKNGNSNVLKGIGVEFDAKENIIKNNIVSGFSRNIDGLSSDTAIVHNNISINGIERGITINALTDLRNNIIAKNEIGLVYPTVTSSDYNLYWQNNTNTTGELAQNDLVADPMFVNDTIPVYGGTYDYHLQKYSPGIDAGDPNILDVDGSRSDIGKYGGPFGGNYTYQDLPPKAPKSFQASYDSGVVTISWDKNSAADFSYYNVYRSTINNFEPDSTNYYSIVDTAFFSDTTAITNGKLYYRITAVDSCGNQSVPGEQITVTITGIDEGEVEIVGEYKLYQNYPNPFNPATIIPFKLKERAYVKVMVYDIKGELLKVLVNETREAGYYEAEFNGSNFASGIYLYRIEVIGDGNIPAYMEMKKMILIK